MGLADEARKMTGTNGPVCSIVTLYRSLTPAQAREARKAIDNPDVPATGLVRAMKARGWDVPSSNTIQRHRRRDCSCG